MIVVCVRFKSSYIIHIFLLSYLLYNNNDDDDTVCDVFSYIIIYYIKYLRNNEDTFNVCIILKP